MREPRITQVADGVHFAESGSVNWALLTDGTAVTLVDAGYPADFPALRHSVETIGHRLRDITAVLLTHAHIDHIGGLPALLDEVDAPIHATAPEAAHARREFLEQATPLDVARNLWRPGVLPWAVHIIRAGALKPVKIPTATPFPAGGRLDLPGNPVPVATPGHTTGHAVYHLPEAGVVITGDTLVSGHPTSIKRGPQLLHPFFSKDQGQVITALDTLAALDADVVLPGHGGVHRGPIGEAVAQAKLGL